MTNTIIKKTSKTLFDDKMLNGKCNVIQMHSLKTSVSTINSKSMNYSQIRAVIIVQIIKIPKKMRHKMKP